MDVGASAALGVDGGPCMLERGRQLTAFVIDERDREVHETGPLVARQHLDVGRSRADEVAAREQQRGVRLCELDVTRVASPTLAQRHARDLEAPQLDGDHREVRVGIRSAAAALDGAARSIERAVGIPESHEHDRESLEITGVLQTAEQPAGIARRTVAIFASDAELRTDEDDARIFRRERGGATDRRVRGLDLAGPLVGAREVAPQRRIAIVATQRIFEVARGTAIVAARERFATERRRIVGAADDRDREHEPN